MCTATALATSGLLYVAALGARMIQLLAIGSRGTEYKRFDFPGRGKAKPMLPTA